MQANFARDSQPDESQNQVISLERTVQKSELDVWLMNQGCQKSVDVWFISAHNAANIKSHVVKRNVNQLRLVSSDKGCVKVLEQSTCRSMVPC